MKDEKKEKQRGKKSDREDEGERVRERESLHLLSRVNYYVLQPTHLNSTRVWVLNYRNYRLERTTIRRTYALQYPKISRPISLLQNKGDKYIRKGETKFGSYFC
jgi:hypothetical protein